MGNNVVVPDRQSFETMEQVRLDATVQTILQQGNVNFKDNVASVSDLPATGNTVDDFRMTLDTGWVYKRGGASWDLVAVSGGGGGQVNTIVPGTGISVNSIDPINPVVTNTAPDQVVSLSQGSGIGISGTYPNFTIANTGLLNISTNNVVYVMKNGNDSTGLRNRLDKPFLTINAAIAAAQDGDAVYVYPGTYDSISCNKDLAFYGYGVVFNRVGGAQITVTGTKNFKMLGDFNTEGLVNVGSVFDLGTSGNVFIELQQLGTNAANPGVPGFIFRGSGNYFINIKNVFYDNSDPANGLWNFVNSSSAKIYFTSNYIRCSQTGMNIDSNFTGKFFLSCDIFIIGAPIVFTGCTGAFYSKAVNGIAGSGSVYTNNAPSMNLIIEDNKFIGSDNGIVSCTVGGPNNFYSYGTNIQTGATVNATALIGTPIVDATLYIPRYI